MNLKDFLKEVSMKRKLNYFVVCPDNLGLSIFLPKVLSSVASDVDIKFFNSVDISKDKARSIEKEARKAPSGSSSYNYFVLYSLQHLPTDSVGPLLKAVEESTYSVFIFQSQKLKRAHRTLFSRSVVVKLPFLTRSAVLGNMQSMYYDAKAADSLGLYDGTLQGTIKSLSVKDSVASIKRDIGLGLAGSASLQSDAVVGGLAFHQAVDPYLSPSLFSYLERDDSPDRRRLILTLLSEGGTNLPSP